MYVCNMKIIIKPFKTAAGFQNMRVKITIAFVNEFKRKKRLISGSTCNHPSSEYLLSRLMRYLKK